MRATFLAVFVIAVLSGCQKSDSDPGPGGVTVGEARALDEAAEMLEERKLPEEALEPAVQFQPSTPKPAGAD
ncbi:hypothetical protein GRI39_09755 [Altererythrobacter indicus]|uniref:Uncharacterized protein n=1 Tax=Altericroceibacterium indicum TaxID=374177 RepID=A0A845A7X4_9SPHN|nr:hypothetical protein [Altericroceibacterium indicum]MXP26320.1 hypothetical protein [Altericroceibacterium indicum]